MEVTLEKKIVPKLRFQKYNYNWERKRLGDLGKFVGGGTPSKAINEYWIGNFPWISSSDIIENDIHNIRINRFINEKSIRDSATKIIPKNSILFISRVGVGKLAINKKEICTSQDFTNFIPNESNPYFIAYLFLSKNNLLIRFSQGTSIKGFTKSDIQTLRINIPSLPEQQKIASFLTAVDKKIEQLTQKKTLLETYKKGLMQKVFSQEIRFKQEDGFDYPDWKEKRLDKLSTKCKTKNKKSLIKNVFTNSAVKGIVNQKDYFDKDIANQLNLEGYYVVEKNDFVYNPRISKHAPVGPIKRNKIGEGVMSPLYTVFRVINTNLRYLEFYFGTTFYYKYMKSIANYGARHDRMNISSSDFFKMLIPVPCIDEMNKITSFLNEIDKNIELVNNQLENTKIFKKGLLQQMFV